MSLFNTKQGFRTIAVMLTVSLVCGPILPVSAQVATSTPTTDTSREERDRTADTTPPTIAPHGNEIVEATSEAGAVVSYTAPDTVDDIDGAGTASCTPPSGSDFPVGNTTVTCTATDAAGNTSTISFFVKVNALPPPDIATSTQETATSTPATATTTPAVATSTPDTATSTPEIATSTPDTATSTPGTGSTGSPQATSPDDPTAVSTASAISAELPPEQSSTDNTDFQNIISGTSPDVADESLPLIDASATTTEALAVDPKLTVATSTDGTGSKVGGTIFTGSATASTTVKNILNITRSNVDGPGKTNSSRITADTDNEGTVTTTDDTQAFTGDNQGLGGEGDATIHTGKAVSSAQVLNIVNTNFFNSTGLVLFLNPQNGDSLDLRESNLEYFLDGRVGASPTQLGCTIITCLNSATLQILNKNIGTIDNDVYVRAATGDNIATSTKNGGIDIQTGDAYASAAVLNLVNTNFINSKYLVATFNNFGDMQGDIVLPDSIFFNKFFRNGNTLPDLNSSSFIVNNDNDETFTGTTTAHAITGGNVATTTAGGAGHGEVRTGQAYTSSTSYTAANQTHVGGSSALFVFHVSGSWSGTVKGLPDGLSWRRTDYGIEVYSTGAVLSTSTQGIYNSATFIASSTNKANVRTDVNVWAETGSNFALTENGTSTIQTGDAYAAANVVNMVNTNVVNRNFIYAIFNIAGDWQGDIDFGGHSPNLKITTTVDVPTPTIPGSELTYHFTVANTGEVDANNVVLTTTYDKNLLVLSRSNAISTDTPAGTKWNLGNFAPGASQQVNVTARAFGPGLLPGFSMLLPITATVTSNERDQDDTDNTQRTTITMTTPEEDDSSTVDSGVRRDGQTDTHDTGGGDNSPPPSGGGDNGSGGNNNPPPSGGDGGGDYGSDSNNNPPPSGGGVGGGGAATAGSVVLTGEPGQRTPEALVLVEKTVSMATTTAPMNVDYQVVVTNDKHAGPAYVGVLTDTLYDPAGGVMNTRSWKLDTIEPGDKITLTYTIAFGTSTTAGVYHNVARVTAFNNYATLPYANNMIPVEASSTIEILPNGLVLGVATSTVLREDLHRSNSCTVLLSTNMRPGRSNDADEVKKLQTFLAQDAAVYPQGLVTGYFGPLTTAAVKRFQQKYADEVLTPLGLDGPTGLVYASTLRQINTLACGGAEVTIEKNPEPVSASVQKTIKPKTSTPKLADTTKKDDAPPVKNLFESIGSLFSGFW